MDFQQIIERWGFPVAFALWLMWSHTRELREIRQDLHKLMVITAVVLKTLDVPEAERLTIGTGSEGDGKA